MKSDSNLRVSRTSSKEIAGNAAKYESYREAWSRIKLAQENHFFLEAITIQESIISDRLKRFLSFPTSINPLKEKQNNNRHLGLYQLINAWKKNFPHGVQSGKYADLIAATDAWRSKRNKAIHSIISLKYDETTQSIDVFLNQAKETSEEGTRLAREICNWCEKMKTDKSKNTKSSA